MKTFTMYTDPGHGWLKVPIDFLHSLGVTYQISSYSYRRGEYVYLEEDCDAAVFADAYRAVYKKDPQIKFSHTDRSSRIRSYLPF